MAIAPFFLIALVGAEPQVGVFGVHDLAFAPYRNGTWTYTKYAVEGPDQVVMGESLYVSERKACTKKMTIYLPQRRPRLRI